MVYSLITVAYLLYIGDVRTDMLYKDASACYNQVDELKKTDEQLQIEEVYKCEVVFISKVNLNKPVIIKEEIRNDL